MEMQRNPKALPEQLRYWLLANAVDLHFDWFNMMLTFTKIWNAILPVLRANPLFRNYQSDLS
jgi:hypothetical protein